MTEYQKFLRKKSTLENGIGFKPLWVPDFLFDFQRALVEWSIRFGRSSMFADCGLGKSPMELVWAENVVRKTNRKVLILTPLSVARQMVGEGEKFGIPCIRSYKGEIKGKIVVANYDRIHYFNPNDFEGVVCDESSCLKAFDGVRQKEITQFSRKIPYRLMGTATPAPNDFIELLTTAEALGVMGRMDSLGMFFRNDENSLHPIWWGARWKFKPHAEMHFWRWVCSWARAVRRPSDLGFDDGQFVLPPLEVVQSVIKCSRPFVGFFPQPAVTLKEQNEERKLTIRERCEAAAKKAMAHPCSVLWCHRNKEGDLLKKLVKGSEQITGQSQSDEEREEILEAFSSGQLAYLVSKPSITGFGLNWQHCNHTTVFPSHSFEQWYQLVRRFWRFGQTKKVVVDLITTEGEIGVLKNLQRKASQADRIFDRLVRNMNDALKIQNEVKQAEKIELPKWI